MNLNDFNTHHLSNYFSGIVAYENNDSAQALKFFKSSKYLIKQHGSYLKSYIYALVLEGEVQQATNEIKKNLTKDNSNFFEVHLILALDGIKKKNYKKSREYLQKSYEFINNDKIALIIAETLKKYLYVFEENKISNTKNKFGNFSFINEIFQRCYLDDQNTKAYFDTLVNFHKNETRNMVVDDNTTKTGNIIYSKNKNIINNNKKVIKELDGITDTYNRQGSIVFQSLLKRNNIETFLKLLGVYLGIIIILLILKNNNMINNNGTVTYIIFILTVLLVGLVFLRFVNSKNRSNYNYLRL